MATIAENLQTLQTIKNNIKTSIENKGVSVGDVAFTEYSTKINEITTGGGGGTLETINITENGVYVPSEGVDGYNQVNVNVTTSTEVFVVPDGMKFGSSTLTEIPSNFVFSSVTDMSSMFNRCSSLTTIPLLNTSSVTNMKYMFYYCTSLQSIPLLNTGNVTDMSYMFSDCSSLTTIPLLNTGNVTDMDYMFNDCSSLQSIPLLNTSNITTMYYMFYGCSKLTSIPAIDTSKVTNMSHIFYGCSSLTTIPLLDTSNVNRMDYMFYVCSSLQSLPLLDCGNVTNINRFLGSSNITTLTTLGGFKNLKINWTDNYGLYRLPNITIESVKNIFNNLYDFRSNGDVTTTRTLKINPSTKTMIDEYYYYEEDVAGNIIEEDGASIYAIATNKGWIIS